MKPILFTLFFLLPTFLFAQNDPTGWEQAKQIEKQLQALDNAAYSLGEFKEAQKSVTLLQVGAGVLAGIGVLIGNSQENSEFSAVVLGAAGITAFIAWIVDRASYRKLDDVERHLKRASGTEYNLPDSIE